MNLFNKKNIVITHSGPFHTDDVFAVAVLDYILEGNYELIRTRDQKIIETGDYVVDVGGIYDPEKNRFDHHQQGGAGVRENGIPYSSLGLVWKKFGEKLCGSVEVARDIDTDFVVPIDATDNGVNIYIPTEQGIMPYNLHHYIMALRPAWNEDKRSFDEGFKEGVVFAKGVLRREIIQSKAKIEANVKVLEAYQKSEDKRIIVMDRYYPSGSVLRNYPEPLFLIHPDGDNRYVIRSFRNNPDIFISRKLFPKSWAGKRDGELAEISGVPGALYCHNERWFAVAETEAGAIALAKIASDAPKEDHPKQEV